MLLKARLKCFGSYLTVDGSVYSLTWVMYSLMAKKVVCTLSVLQSCTIYSINRENKMR